MSSMILGYLGQNVKPNTTMSLCDLHFRLHLVTALIAVPWASPRSGLQACTHTVEGAKREKIPTNKERGEQSRDRRALLKN